MKIRLIFTINNLDTAGMKYVLAALVNRIDKEIFTPKIIVNKKTGSALERELESKFEIVELNLRNPGYFHFISNLIKNIHYVKLHGDIVHSFDYSSDWYEALTIKMAGIPFISEKTNLSYSSYRWKLKLRLADHIICLSAAQKNQLQKYAAKISVIPTGVNVHHFITAEPISRAGFGIKHDDIVFISIAHLVKVKGYEELIDAISILKNEFVNIKVICVGKGEPEYESYLKKLTASKNISDRFYFVGNSENIAGMLKMADIKILATQNRGRREAFGAAIVEAMAAGLPVLATRSGGPEDIVVDGVTGWLVDGDGANALVEGIRKCMNNRKSWQEMGNNGRKRAVDLYDESRMVNEYSSVYKKIVAQSKRA